jgi:serine/threonine protein phosphatase PrpC
MKTASFGGTDTGKKRNNNEDAYLLNDALCLYAVADGVGGNEGGEVASRIAVDTLAEVLPGLLGEGDRTPPLAGTLSADPSLSALEHAFTLSNRRIRQVREQSPEISSMGTTLTAFLIRKGRAFIAHVGDSRAYLSRAGVFRQLTNDHSVVAQQVLAGSITPEHARRSPYRHVITRALGMDDRVAVDTIAQDIQQGDIFFLCTDGLTEMVEDEVISRTLAGADARDAVQKLLAAANEQGGVDNITAVVVKIEKI